MKPPIDGACPHCGAPAREVRRCATCGLDLPAAAGPAGEPVFEGECRSGPRGGPIARLHGAIAAAGETAWRLASSPGRTFRSFRFEGRILPALAYALLLGAPALVVWAAARAVVWQERAWLAGPRLAALALGAPLAYVYFRAQAVHLGLVLGGRARGTFASTFRVVGYSSGSAAPLLAVPFAGEFLFLFLGAYIETLGLKECHALTFPQAVLAEAVPALALLTGITAALLTSLSVSWHGAR